jgi:hypothetical protein
MLKPIIVKLHNVRVRGQEVPLTGVKGTIWEERKEFFILYLFWWDEVWTQGFTLSKQVFCLLSHTSSPHSSGYFGAGVSWTIYPGWPQTSILLISASQVARITGVSYQCPVYNPLLKSIIGPWVQNTHTHTHTHTQKHLPSMGARFWLPSPASQKKKRAMVNSTGFL